MGARFLVIGNPDNRRVTLFRDAALQEGCEVRVVSWLQVIRARAEFVEASGDPQLVRIDSWGEDREVERALLRRGFESESEFPSRARLTPAEIDAATSEYGRIAAPRQAHDGALSALSDLERALAARPRWHCLQPISAIRTLFDKRATHELARELGVRVPLALPAVGDPDALFAEMDRHALSSVYVKVGCTSSASCLALVERSRQGTSVTTSVEIDGKRLYNSLRVRRYARPELLGRVLRFLLAEGAHVEQAIDKLPSAGRHCDVRLLFVRDAAPFAVLRTSHVPITNLHLGGRRGDLDAYRRKLPKSAWDEAVAFGERLAARLRTWHLGVDLAFERRSGQAFVLEANAFGDLLPGLERDGRSVYAWEIRAARGTP